jgi:hypothetical protein
LNGRKNRKRKKELQDVPTDEARVKKRSEHMPKQSPYLLGQV